MGLASVLLCQVVNDFVDLIALMLVVNVFAVYTFFVLFMVPELARWNADVAGIQDGAGGAGTAGDVDDAAVGGASAAIGDCSCLFLTVLAVACAVMLTLLCLQNRTLDPLGCSI